MDYMTSINVIFFFLIVVSSRNDFPLHAALIKVVVAIGAMGAIPTILDAGFIRTS